MLEGALIGIEPILWSLASHAPEVERSRQVLEEGRIVGIKDILLSITGNSCACRDVGRLVGRLVVGKRDCTYLT